MQKIVPQNIGHCTSKYRSLYHQIQYIVLPNTVHCTTKYSTVYYQMQVIETPNIGHCTIKFRSLYHQIQVIVPTNIGHSNTMSLCQIILKKSVLKSNFTQLHFSKSVIDYFSYNYISKYFLIDFSFFI